MEIIPTLNGQKRARRAKLKGRSYLVAEMTMLVPGVLNGSAGPVYYSAEDVSYDVDVWNGVPIVVYHPQVTNADGTKDYVSARSPEILDKYEIGTVLNATWSEAETLAAEGWFDEQRTKEVDVRVYNALLKGEPIELSTGMFLNKKKAKKGATFNGKAYAYEAKAPFKADHLAVLPDVPGACSLKDGCGVGVTTNELELTENELSHEQLRQEIADKLRSCFTQSDPGCYVAYVYDSYFIYEQGNNWYKQTYTQTETGVVLGKDKPVKVLRQIIFTPTSNSEDNHVMATMSQADRSKIVTYLTTNCECWKGQEEILGKLTDAALVNFQKKLEKSLEQEAVVKAAQEGFGTILPAELKEKAQMLANSLVKDKDGNKTEKKEVTVNAGTVTTPTLTPEQIEDLEFARNEKNRQRSELIARLTANLEDAKKAEAAKIYATMGLNQLKVLADSLPAPVTSQTRPAYPDYSGAGFPVHPAVNSQNRSKFDPTDVMPDVSMDWSKK